MQSVIVTRMYVRPLEYRHLMFGVWEFLPLSIISPSCPHPPPPHRSLAITLLRSVSLSLTCKIVHISENIRYLMSLACSLRITASRAVVANGRPSLFLRLPEIRLSVSARVALRLPSTPPGWTLGRVPVLTVVSNPAPGLELSCLFKTLASSPSSEGQEVGFPLPPSAASPGLPAPLAPGRFRLPSALVGHCSLGLDSSGPRPP